MTPPASTMISARIKRVQEHSSRLNVVRVDKCAKLRWTSVVRVAPSLDLQTHAMPFAANAGAGAVGGVSHALIGQPLLHYQRPGYTPPQCFMELF